MFALNDPIRRDSGKKKEKKAGVKFIKRHLFKFWLPSEKGWCDCCSAGTLICHPAIPTTIGEATTEVISIFSEKGGCYFSFT